MRRTITVLIVDDHPMVRDGLQVFLSVHEDLEVVGEAENGEQAIGLCAELRPDVVLMDMVMPGMDGPTATSRIRQLDQPPQVIALTSFDDQQLVGKALRAGAVGFLHKDVHADRLADAIRDAAAGRGTLDAAATQALIETTQEPAPMREELTPREQEVLRLLVQGMTNKQIAGELRVSQATARLHVSNILAKLGVANRTEAVSVALQNNLV